MQYENNRRECHVKDPNAKFYGLRFEFPFDQLKYFHVTNGLPFDVDHDLFEGVVDLVIEEFMKYAVEKKYFTLDFLNEEMLSFSYAEDDLSNKPSTMSCDKNHLILSQCWCVLRLFPLIAGNEIPLFMMKNGQRFFC